MKGLLVVCAAMALASPTLADSLFDFGMGMADARVPMGADTFNIWISARQDKFLMEPSMKIAFSGGGHFPEPTWRTIAEAFVKPIGCGISDVKPISKAGSAWEAIFVCPPGVDLHALARTQRHDLQSGEPLHP